jgi:hypothetical protein
MRLVTAYYTKTSEPLVPEQRVAFGASGHRGSAFEKSFNERHILAISRAICLHRERKKIDGPLFLGMDTRGTRIQIGAQNLYWAKEGEFTGEVSGPMIRASGCSHVIVGHSERRQYFGETNESVLKKTVAALDAGLIPIVCVEEREKRNMEEVLTEQFRYGISALSEGQFARIVIADEPVWAIRSRRDRRAGCRRRCSPAHPRPGEAPVRSRGCEQFPHPIRRQRQARQCEESHGASRDRRIPRRRCQSRFGQLFSDRESLKLDVAFSTRTGHRASRF